MLNDLFNSPLKNIVNNSVLFTAADMHLHIRKRKVSCKCKV